VKESAGVWQTTDLGSAAYAHSQGLVIRAVDRNGGEVVFSFDDPKGVGPRLALDYTNSTVLQRYDNSMRALKKLAFGGPEKSRRR
jgi:hypothetical protein